MKPWFFFIFFHLNEAFKNVFQPFVYENKPDIPLILHPHPPTLENTIHPLTYSPKPTPLIVPSCTSPSSSTSPGSSNEGKNPDNEFHLNWYVIDETKRVKTNIPYQVTIWGKKYVYWRDKTGQIHAIQDACSHRGAYLSRGRIIENTKCIRCPYHGLEFDGEGKLRKIPGQSPDTKIPNALHQESFYVTEKEGWLWMNLMPRFLYPNVSQEQFNDHLYQEPESSFLGYSKIHALIPTVKTSSQTLSENLLDILHITYVHSFGNMRSPIPLNEPSPYQIRSFVSKDADSQKKWTIFFKDYLDQSHNKTELSNLKPLLAHKEIILTPILPHYGIVYLFKPREESFIVQQFGYRHITIENEFLLPHTTVSRVKFGPFVKTIVGFSLPLNDTHTRLFVKMYRNYWVKPWIQSNDTSPFLAPFLSVFNLLGDIYQAFGDVLMEYVLYETIKEDQSILENLDALSKHKGGKYNLKYDKFPHMYRMMYQKNKKISSSKNHTRGE